MRWDSEREVREVHPERLSDCNEGKERFCAWVRVGGEDGEESREVVKSG